MAGEAHKPTEDSRKLVSELSSFGIPQENICKIVKVSLPTLHKYYRDELDLGMDIANAEVARTLYRMAVSGDSPASTFFWLKTRAKWRETDDDKQTLEITVNGQPTKTNGKD